MWKLNNIYLNNQYVKDEMTNEIRKILRWMKVKTQSCQNLWNVAITVLRGEFIALKTYIANEKRLQINKLTLCLKTYRKREKIKYKENRRK